MCERRSGDGRVRRLGVCCRGAFQRPDRRRYPPSPLPYTQTLDVTGATTDADDAEVNETCGAPVTNNSVWYTFTAGASDTALVVDTTGSDYSSGVIIATGSPGAADDASVRPGQRGRRHYVGHDLLHLGLRRHGFGWHAADRDPDGPGPVPPNDKPGGATEVSAFRSATRSMSRAPPRVPPTIR